MGNTSFRSPGDREKGGNMKITDIVITVTLITILAVSVAAFNMPSLLGRPIVPGLTQQAAPQLSTQKLMPEDLKAHATEETFRSLSPATYTSTSCQSGASDHLPERPVLGKRGGDLAVPSARCPDRRYRAGRRQIRGYTGSTTGSQVQTCSRRERQERQVLYQERWKCPKAISRISRSSRRLRCHSPADVRVFGQSLPQRPQTQISDIAGGRRHNQDAGNTIGMTNGAIAQPAPVRRPMQARHEH
jgi:hypothetical protein